MGIYTNGSIYGIQIYCFGDDDISRILYEKSYPETMTFQEKKEAYLFYTQFPQKQGLFFKIYTTCSSSSTSYYDGDKEKVWMQWCSMSLAAFIETFGFIHNGDNERSK